MKADELREALYTCLPEYTRLADDEIKILARTICTTLGITREKVEGLRVFTPFTGHFDGGLPPYPEGTFGHLTNDTADALTALLDLAEGEG